jgi:hypothetical protein
MKLGMVMSILGSSLVVATVVTLAETVAQLCHSDPGEDSVASIRWGEDILSYE